jgi:hypothetical protein
MLAANTIETVGQTTCKNCRKNAAKRAKNGKKVAKNAVKIFDF